MIQSEESTSTGGLKGRATHNSMPLKYITPLHWCSYYPTTLSCSFSRKPGETKILAKEGKRLCSQGDGLEEEGSWRRSVLGRQRRLEGQEATLLLESSQGPLLPDRLPSLPERGWVPSCSHSQAAPAVILSLCPWPGRRPKAAHQCLLFRALLARRNREAALPARTLRSFLSKSGPHPPFGPAPTAIPPQPGALPGRRDFKGPVPDLPRPRWVRGPQSEATAGSLTSGLPQSRGLREPRGGAGL